MTKRYLDIDFCKGLLIVMVVWGHFCAHSSGADYEKNALTMYIRLFQMPLFFMISGLFQKRITNTVEFLYSVKRCFYRLGLPLISFSIMDYMARGLFQNDLGGVFSLLWRGPILYWFFTCLIFCKIVFSFVDLLANKYRYNSVLAHIASLLLLCMIPHEFFYLPFNYLFFLIGVVFMDKHIPQIPGRYIIVGCIITVFAGYFFPTKWTFYSINMYIFDDILFKPFFLLFRWIIYVTATFSAFELMRRFYKHYPTSKLSCAFSKLGNKTLLIYGFHLFIVADVYGYFVKQHYAPQGLLPGHPWIRYYVMASILTILTVLLCVWLNKWIHKSQILAQFILGENIHV